MSSPGPDKSVPAEAASCDLGVPNAIRVETALSRYPIHRLSKRGNIRIEFSELSPSGDATIAWEVSYNSKYGQPGPLAYKIDTLIINRRLEEAPRPIPKVIRLGSLREIERELGLSESGSNREQIKKAIYQNAFAAITPKIRYLHRNGTRRTLESGFTRYSVVFRGEKLPDGLEADAVHIVLNDIFRQILDGAMTRPLDYDYLRDLAPTAQRFYELISFRIYAALKNGGGQQARMTYSEFCRYAPQTRYLESDRAKKQMYKIHSVHKKSGYIDAVEFQKVMDAEGRPDWVMLYTPGLRARAEFEAFGRRGGPRVFEIGPDTSEAPDEDHQLDLEFMPEEVIKPVGISSPALPELTRYNVTPAMASKLIRDHGEDRVLTQLEHLDWLLETGPEKVTDPAAWLVVAIRQDHAPPRGFVSRAERRRRAAEAREARRKQKEAVEAVRREEARLEAEEALLDARWKTLAPAELATLDEAALAAADETTRHEATRGRPGNPTREIFRAYARRAYLRSILVAEGELPIAD